MATFPKAQFNAIQRGKPEDIEARNSSRDVLSSHISDLRKKEAALNDLYWSLFSRGRCEDKFLAEHFAHERNALRVRINRLVKRQRIIL